MADQASSSTTISASVEDVLAVIRDVESYPAWANGITKVVVHESGPDGPQKVTFTASQSGFSDEYTLVYDWRPDGVAWTLDAPTKVQKSQVGSYLLTGDGTSTTVLYTLSVGMIIPMIGMMKRRIEGKIIDTALKGLKKRVESLG